VVAIAALLPSAVTGHAGHHNSPVMAAVTLGVHVSAAALWVGGLLALIVHLRAYPDQLRRAVPRFSAVALGCVLAVGASGVLESAVMLGSWDALLHTTRGQLMAAKAAALIVLVGIGFWHRRRTVPAAASGRLIPLLQLGVGELLVMGATIGIAVVLSTTA
jgi:putative copper export protein